MRKHTGMGMCRRSLRLAFLLIGLLTADSALAGGGPKNVLLVVNDNSPVSQSIAAYYKSKRGIPDRNICHIQCSTSECVDKDECQDTIVMPIRQFLEDPVIHDRIDYIVLTKGIPLKASYYDSSSYGPLSVASVLTCVGIPSQMYPCTNPFGPTAYPLLPAQYFSHKLVFGGKSFYVVARLDGYTEDHIHNMIDDSVSAQPGNGSFMMDGRHEENPNSYTGKANHRIRQANQELLDAGFSTYYDADEFDDQITEFAGGQPDLMGYFSWGSNEASYTLGQYISNSFVRGSIADSYVSFSMRSFDYPPTYGQSLIPDLVAQGLSGGNGYVSEPDIRYATYPNVLFNRYVQGYNMGESFFAATPRLFWKSVMIGDPLMAPYATPPQVTIVSPSGSRSVCGTVKILAEASDASGIGKVEAYVDDLLVGSADVPPYEIDWNTANYADGAHRIEVIAYEAGPVYTQGCAAADVVVQNTPTDVGQIGGLTSIPDGAMVRLMHKIVTGGTDAFLDGAYIGEEDRSSGIRIVGPSMIADTGAMVTVEGVVDTVECERVVNVTSLLDVSPPVFATQGIVTAAIVESLGEPALRPYAMPNRYIANRGGCSGPEYDLLVAGLSNTSMLVRAWGYVVESGDGDFRISDGSLEKKDAVITNIRVSLQNMVLPPAPPPVGCYVMVTGIACHTLENGMLKPTIRPRYVDDIIEIAVPPSPSLSITPTTGTGGTPPTLGKKSP